MSFDYNAPAELFLAKRTKSRRAKYRRFATAAEAIRYGVEDLPSLRALGAWLEVGDERFNRTKFNDCTKLVIIRCASLSDRASGARVRNESQGPLNGLSLLLR